MMSKDKPKPAEEDLQQSLGPETERLREAIRQADQRYFNRGSLLPDSEKESKATPD